MLLKLPLEDAPRGVDYDLVCLSHLRWGFVYQRPQHLLSRFARAGRVYFIEEPIDDDRAPFLDLDIQDNLVVVTPHLPSRLGAQASAEAMRGLIDDLFEFENIKRYVLWYYTPMMLPFTQHLSPLAVVYDCMDELSAFAGAPPEMLSNEAKLLARADLVTTGGQSLYEAKRDRHPNVHAFASSVDTAHFAQARGLIPEHEAQRGLPPGPRMGFFGVIDERFDCALIAEAARMRPEWQFVMVGPVVKIAPDSLPKAPNLHYLGSQPYAALPSLLAGWGVALMPFARNESTRFISPTKTPEYLAAGRPVVSTSIRDVVRPYGEKGLVEIADAPEDFVAAIERCLDRPKAQWLRAVDEHLSGLSWDNTYAAMRALVDRAVSEREHYTQRPLNQLGGELS